MNDVTPFKRRIEQTIEETLSHAHNVAVVSHWLFQKKPRKAKDSRPKRLFKSLKNVV